MVSASIDKPDLNDLGLLISILHSAEPSAWRNIGRTLRHLRPKWSSLAVDTWRRSDNASAADVRRVVYARHGGTLELFNRVLFLDTAPREHINGHVRPSFSYRLHWHASFGDYASRWPLGPHAEGLPLLLAGIDADVVVPHRLPLARIAKVLAASAPSSPAAVSAAEARARDVWVHGKVPGCSAAAIGIDPRSSPCEVVTKAHQPLFISPRNLDMLGKERRTSFAELGFYFSSLGMGNCCGRQNIDAPIAMSAGATVATLSRGPWCPPSTFWILHRRSLDRLLSSFTLWQQAWDTRALTPDQKRMRWEFTSCSLLAPGEATLLLYYNHSELRYTREGDASGQWKQNPTVHT